ncbi:hypothetical protein [Streptoalloteichus hindustanus]|uniref:Uncharacterized protein n=1 Tax=Streptoalloteichus hindustanus TaxID=2017 RepID=A0A1M5AM71_STRHI|nr:hypothetical protein [Streptoalloteichus hindustanus]SHF31266.1 hypothetical protein SAMN05444320_103182 [Streptoalloteichus hindustanus]
MSEAPKPDHSTVYQAIDEKPRLFALCYADAVALVAEGEPIYEVDVVGWGFEFSDKTVVVLRSPGSGIRSMGTFGSAERARALFSRARREPLEVVYQ